MPRRSTEAIILRTRPVGDSDLIVSFLAEGEGKIEGAAKAARKSRRRFGGALEPMTRGRVTWTETEGKERVRLESFDVVVSFARRQAALEWFYLFAYLAEVADTFAREREPDARFYRLLRAVTDASEAGSSVGLLRRWFEVWTLRLQGLLPGLESCSRCGSEAPPGGLAIATAAGETFCDACALERESDETIVRLTAEELEWIRMALTRPPSRMLDPGKTPGIGRMTHRLFVEFTGKTFRTARFLDAV